MDDQTKEKIMLRSLFRRDHAPSRSCGCVGCGGDLADIHTVPEPPQWPDGEGYCWTCVHTWPAEVPVAAYNLLPGASPSCPWCDVTSGRHRVTPAIPVRIPEPDWRNYVRER